MRGQDIPLETIDRMVGMYVDGSSVSEIARQLVLSTGAIRNHLARRGVYEATRDLMSRYPSPRLDEQQIDQAVQGYLGGLTIAEVASRMAVSYGYTRNLLLSRGVSLRRRGRQTDLGGSGAVLGDGSGDGSG